MTLDEHTLHHHDSLSHEGGALARALCAGDVADGLQIDWQDPALPRLLQNYMYRVCPWPLLISAQTKGAFARIVRAMPSLMYRAILRCFDGDPAGFSAHYNLSPIVYQLLSDMDDPTDLFVRYDLVLVGHKPKLLEINVGSKLGGWHVGWLWPQLANKIRQRAASRDWTISHTSTATTFLRELHRSLHAHIGAEAVGNVLILTDPASVERRLADDLAAIYDGIAAGGPRRGRVWVDVNLDGVTIDSGGRVRHRGAVVDCVLFTEPGVRMPTELIRAHARKRVFLPDGPLHAILGHKTNFAILHALKTAGRLSESDARLVDEYIPWSALVTDGVAEWEGETHPVQDIARTRKDELVLKRGLSVQGRDVFVGHFLTDADWAAAIARAGTNGQWLLQAYCPSDRLYAPDDDGGVAEHEAIWGVFGFGHEYGGAFGRLMKANTGRGVVNSARGALECVVLEV